MMLGWKQFSAAVREIGIVERSTVVANSVERLGSVVVALTELLELVQSVNVWRRRWRGAAKEFKRRELAWMAAYDRVQNTSADALAELDRLRQHVANLEPANKELAKKRASDRTMLASVMAELADAGVEINRLRKRLAEESERANGNSEALIIATESANVWRDKATEWQAEALRLRAALERESGTRLATGTH